MIKPVHLLRAGCIAAALFSSSLVAATVNGTLQKDVMAKEKFPTTNFGADTQLQVSSQTGYAKITFLEFTVAGIPAGSTGITAQLKLRSQTTGTAAITAHAVASTSWTEAGLTWSNKPALGATLSTDSSHTAGTDSTWAVGAHVTGNGTFALGLDRTDAVISGDTIFTSEEGGVAPVLVVTYTPPAGYFVYRGNTHSHTTYTSSHGEVPPANGPPSEHHAQAKAAGYDFYVTTDHSQEVAFDPTSATNTAWVATKNQAAAATDSTYVGLAGYEHSENNGDSQGPQPGNGHINVINSNAYLDALEAGNDLPTLYSWLATAAPNGSGLPVVASFNHPGTTQYNNWAYRTAAATDIITLLEVINSNNGIHEDAYRAANNAGWKVGPTCGNDNHGFWGITNHSSRVGVLATAKTKAAILDAMKNRRTFVSTDKNATLHFTANGTIMGSTLSSPSTITFVVTASDPDTGDANDRLTLIQIVDPTNTVVASTTISTYSTVWTSPAVSVSGKKYFYVRARNVGSGTSSMAWTAPIWTGL